MDTQAPGATQYDAYVPGSKDPLGRMIKNVVGVHRQMIVYVTDPPAVGWNYDHLPERLRPAVTEFQILNGLASSCLSKKLRFGAVALMAPALYAALLTQKGEDPKTAFTVARSYITRKSTDRARLYYMLFSLLSSLLLSLPCFLPYLVSWFFHLDKPSGIFPLVAIGVTGGVIGAEISIIQRGWQLQIDPLESVLYVAAQGLVRVVLGAVFGVVLVVLSKADLAFGSFASNPWALFGLSVAAGLSERLVPDLLQKTARGTTGEAEQFGLSVAAGLSERLVPDLSQKTARGTTGEAEQ